MAHAKPVILPKRRYGVRARFVSLILVLLVVVFAIITTLLVSHETRILRENLAEQTRAFAALATPPIGNTFLIYQDSGRVKISEQIRRYTDLNSSITSVAIADSYGRTVFSQRGNGRAISTQDAGSAEPIYHTDQRGFVYQAVYPFLEDSGFHRYSVVYDVSSAEANKAIGQSAGALVGIGAAGIGLTALLIYTFVNTFFLRPLRRMSKEAQAISGGALDQQIKLGRKDEVGDLAQSINCMATSLKADIQKLRELDEIKSEFMIIASHNLRTPLTALTGYLELLQSAATQSPEQITQLVEVLSANSQRLKDFIENLLTVANFETGHFNTSMTEHSLTDIVDQLSGSFEPFAKQKSIHYGASLPSGPASILCNPAYIRTALWNILDNAHEFTPAGGEVAVTLSEEPAHIRLTVRDTGSGIDPAELPLLFTKFHRGTDIMKYEHEGIGLGLYLTKLIVDLHKGTIHIASKVGEGTTVTITFPRTK